MARRISRRTQIARLLDDTPSPIFIVDADRRIAYANRALGDWLQLDPDKMVGLECPYSSQSQSPVAGLGPPPAVLAGDSGYGSVWKETHDGKTESRPAQFIPIPSGHAAYDVLVVTEVAEEGQASASPQPQERPSDLETDAAKIHAELWRLRGSLAKTYRMDELVGNSPAMQRVRSQIAAAVAQPTNVLVIGAIGSGRERIARTICAAEPLSSANEETPPPPMATLSAPLLDIDLLESTVASFLGRCAQLEVPGLPTLLILDADNLIRPVQDVLHELFVTRGLPLRAVSTSAHSLIELARAGEFHEGLAFYLSAAEITVPELAERAEDIPLLVQHFVEVWNAETHKQVQGVDEAALSHFMLYPWSRHVGELREMVFAACEATQQEVVGVDALPFPLRAAVDAALHPPQQLSAMPLDELLQRTEAEAIGNALGMAKGNRAQAARLLKISRSRLLRRIEQLGLDKEDDE